MEVKGGKPEYVLALEDARNTVKEVKKNLMPFHNLYYLNHLAEEFREKIRKGADLVE